MPGLSSVEQFSVKAWHNPCKIAPKLRLLKMEIGMKSAEGTAVLTCVSWGTIRGLLVHHVPGRPIHIISKALCIKDCLNFQLRAGI